MVLAYVTFMQKPFSQEEEDTAKGDGDRSPGTFTSIYGAIYVRSFIGALTRGGPGGMPRPIEMHAHDPRRFVSDMLAWVHQARC